jgi:hypothetical protein
VAYPHYGHLWWPPSPCFGFFSWGGDTVRRIVYPNYKAEVVEGGDVRLRFVAPGSKFGAVEVILIADDAMELLRQLDKALDKSDALLAGEGT